MKEYIIYTGTIFMPDMNAAAQRAKAMAKLIQSCGYTPVIVGMTSNVHNILDTKKCYDNIQCYSMNYPASMKDWLYRIISIEELICVVRHIGSKNVKAIIAMDYYAAALIRLNKFCEKNDMILIADAVDWFEKSDYQFPANFVKDFDTVLRMKYIYKKFDRMITISVFLNNYYKGAVNRIVRIPGISYSKGDYEYNYIPNRILTLTHVGRPGKKCEKEKIDWMIKIACDINSKQKKVHINIAGVSLHTLKKYRPDIVGLNEFDSTVTIYGRIPHSECMQLITQSDFSFIIREDTLLSKAGFPSKLGESYVCGTPVLATPAGNVQEFIPKTHGFVSSKCTYESVKSMIDTILKLDKSYILQMHHNVKKRNVLSADLYVDEMRKILS